MGAWGRLDVLVNNAGEQHPDKDITDITEQQLRRTFQTNVFGMFFMTQAARPHLEKGAAIVNCTSVTMYQGSKDLLDIRPPRARSPRSRATCPTTGSATCRESVSR